MNFRFSGKLMMASGILCFAVAFILLNSFRGEFGKDTAGSSDMPQMEDTIDITPNTPAAGTGAERVVSVAQSAQPSAKWVVYVTGAVRNPGVYEIAPSSRVYEALNAAGGFSSDADQEAINLASPLSDGVHIKFPRKGENFAQQPQSPAPAAGQPASSSRQSASRSAPASGKININTAGAGELVRLSGIGEKTAQSIIDHRAANGPFRRVEDLMNVKGIGPKKFDAIKDDVTIDG